MAEGAGPSGRGPRKTDEGPGLEPGPQEETRSPVACTNERVAAPGSLSPPQAGPELRPRGFRECIFHYLL